jgi:hypothetical protein
MMQYGLVLWVQKMYYNEVIELFFSTQLFKTSDTKKLAYNSMKKLVAVERTRKLSHKQFVSV